MGISVVHLVTEYLSSEGYKYEIDEDGDVHFKYEGTHMYFTVDKNDPSFFRLLMPGVYRLEGDRTKLLGCLNEIVAETKVLKAFLIGDQVHLSVEIFLDTTPEIKDFFPRCVDLLKEGRNRLAKKVLLLSLS